jgi:hypothetical protein
MLGPARVEAVVVLVSAHRVVGRRDQLKSSDI